MVARYRLLERMNIHLAIDAVGAKHGGAATVLIDVLNAAIDNPCVAKITLFCSPSDQRMFKLPLSDKLIEVPKPSVDKNHVLRILWYEWLLGLECRRIRADVLLASVNFGRGRLGIPHVTFVQQSLPFSVEALSTYKSVFKSLKIKAYRWLMRRSCRSAVRTICQSTVIKKVLVDSFCLDRKRVIAVYPSPKDLMTIIYDKSCSRGNGLLYGKKNLLYVGNDRPYKKIITLAHGIKLIREQIPGVELNITLPADCAFSSMHGVRCLGYLDEQELTNAYRAASILVLPSLVETVGMPTLEAMSLGTPVLVSDRPYAHDICENAALFFDPNSPEDFAEKAIRLLTDTELRSVLINRGYSLIARRRKEGSYARIIDIIIDSAAEHYHC